MSAIYYESDGNLTALAGKRIGIIGYSAIGRSFAHHLAALGIPVLIADETDAAAQARADGMVTAIDVASLVREVTILIFALPDEQLTQTYMQSVSPNLHKNHTLVLTSAYVIAFGFVEPPPFVDVMLIAPRHVPEAASKPPISYIAMWQDASRQAWDTVLAVARAVGALRSGGIEINIEQEAQISLFIQQAVLPAFYHIITTAADLLMREGYPAEAVLSDLYLSGHFSGFLMRAMQTGIHDTLTNDTLTRQFATLSRLDRFNDLKLERLMEVTLEDIRSGRFAKEWSQELSDGLPRFSKLRKQHDQRDVWELEQQTLDMLGDPPPDHFDL